MDEQPTTVLPEPLDEEEIEQRRRSLRRKRWLIIAILLIALGLAAAAGIRLRDHDLEQLNEIDAAQDDALVALERTVKNQEQIVIVKREVRIVSQDVKQLEAQLTELGVLPGKSGERGAPGARGETGAAGKAGQIGEAGTAGESIVGPQGEQGPQGVAGESIVGPQGPQGERGPQGPQGEPGSDCPNTVTVTIPGEGDFTLCTP
jgi:Collagen triple helix repeat (20 copies)